MPHIDDSATFNVTARAPFHMYYEGPAQRVSAANSVGQFDVLPGHAEFFSILLPCEVAIETNTDLITFRIDNGIIAVRDATVMLFVNI